VTYDLVVGGDTSSDESTQEEDVDIEIEELQFYRDIEPAVVIQNTEHQSRLGSIRRIASNVASRHATRRILGFVVGCALSFVFTPKNHNSRDMPTAARITSKEVEEDLIDDESEEYTTPIQPADLDKSFLDKLISLLLVYNRSHI